MVIYVIILNWSFNQDWVWISLFHISPETKYEADFSAVSENPPIEPLEVEEGILCEFELKFSSHAAPLQRATQTFSNKRQDIWRRKKRFFFFSNLWWIQARHKWKNVRKSSPIWIWDLNGEICLKQPLRSVDSSAIIQCWHCRSRRQQSCGKVGEV